MIEELEVGAVSQMVSEEQGRTRGRVTCEHEGVTIEVRARRRRDGAAVLGYSFNGVRLERAVLLMLICPVAACERSQSVRREWAARNPPKPALQRRPLTGLKAANSRVDARLFEEALIQGTGGLCVARPASFVVPIVCPVGAHLPMEMRLDGWDLFRDGEYLAGGLVEGIGSDARRPMFQTLNDVISWVDQIPE